MPLRLDFFTPTRKPIDYTTTADGRSRRVYDKPRIPWQQVLDTGILPDAQAAAAQAPIHGMNPAYLTQRINAIQMRLLELAQAKTQALATSRHIDLESSRPSINRLTTTE